MKNRSKKQNIKRIFCIFITVAIQQDLASISSNQNVKSRKKPIGIYSKNNQS